MTKQSEIESPGNTLNLRERKQQRLLDQARDVITAFGMPIAESSITKEKAVSRSKSGTRIIIADRIRKLRLAAPTAHQAKTEGLWQR